MKFFLFSSQSQNKREILHLSGKNKGQEFLFKQGKEQFQKLLKRGLTVPVVLL